MNTIKHTPGPAISWEIGEPDKGKGLLPTIYQKTPGTYTWVATCSPDHLHLIAAAPELLDYLKRMLDEANDPAGFRLSTIGEAMAAIAKAEGRS